MAELGKSSLIRQGFLEAGQEIQTVITSDCLFVLPSARPRKSGHVAVLVAFELATAIAEAPQAAESLIQFRATMSWWQRTNC